MAPEESSAAGANPAARSATSSSPIGACDTATVGRQQPHLEVLQRGAASAHARAGSVLAPDERGRHPDPKLSVPAGDVIDQVAQPRGTGVFECRSKNACSVPAVRPVSSACLIEASLTR